MKHVWVELSLKMKIALLFQRFYALKALKETCVIPVYTTKIFTMPEKTTINAINVRLLLEIFSKFLEY